MWLCVWAAGYAAILVGQVLRCVASRSGELALDGALDGAEEVVAAVHFCC